MDFLLLIYERTEEEVYCGSINLLSGFYCDFLFAYYDPKLLDPPNILFAPTPLLFFPPTPADDTADGSFLNPWDDYIDRLTLLPLPADTIPWQ